ncbi:MAG: hypothetical protein AB1480_15815 [Nitrospirota bacterium]
MVTGIYNRLASYSEIMALKEVATSLSGITGVEKVIFFGSHRKYRKRRTGAL